MTNELRHELEKFEEEELIQRIAKNWLTEEANQIVIEILEERGCNDLLEKIEAAKVKHFEESELQDKNDKRQRNFLILQALIIFSVLPTIFFPFGENPTPPFLVFIFMELIALPIGVAVLRGFNKKMIGILILVIVVMPFVGWLGAIFYSFKKQ
jgi:hypothetical protein